MGKITVQEKQLVFQRRDELIVIEPYGTNCLRVRATRNSKVADLNWTLLPPATPDSCVISGDEQTAFMTNGTISVRLESGNQWWGGVLTFCRNGKQILHTRFEGDYVNNYIHVEGDHYQVKAIFDANEGEHFYGLGQETEDAFDRKGSTCSLIHYNTKSTVPYLYSSLGYGFFWNNPSPGRCETTRNHTLWLSESAYQIDYLVFTGETPADVMKIYCDLTGYAPKFPSWASGFWQCKMRYESQDELMEVAKEYKARNIPIAVMVVDFFHWTEQGNWDFDKTYWPDPEGMCKELREMGIQPIVSVWPTINPNSENWLEMNERNLLVRTENGQYGTFNFLGQQTFIDAMNPETRAFVWQKLKEHYYDCGFHAFWLDEAEPEVHPQQFGHLHFYLGNGAQTAMLYPYYYVKMVYDGLKQQGQDEIIILTRAAWAGSQKLGALVWNGDIGSNWTSLRQSVTSGLSMAMCGIPWWTTDIGGFGGGITESDDFRELIVRWFQFGLFSPVMRLHGDRIRTKDQPNLHPGILQPGGGPNEIWRFGDRNYGILKDLIETRERLRPYIHACMDENSRTGAPIMRPMFYDYYTDETCYTLEDQYFFGPDILFAPIMERGITSRRVYLPEGRWINVNTHDVVEGKCWIEAEADLAHFIAFVKEGSLVLSAFEAR